jgi:hypothetical protein
MTHNKKTCPFCKEGAVVIEFNKKAQEQLKAHWKDKK